MSTIFIGPSQDKKLAKAVADSLKVKLVVIDSLQKNVLGSMTKMAEELKVAFEAKQ